MQVSDGKLRRAWVIPGVTNCSPPTETKPTVILSEAKDLQFRSEANQCRFFASLRMTDVSAFHSCAQSDWRLFL